MRRRLLLVEDDPDQLAIRRAILDQAGWEVEAAASVDAALAAVAARAPDVVLLDLRVPRIEDGLALIRSIRAGAPSVRIAVLSGFPADLASAAERALVDACLEKPARSRQLLDVLARLVACLILALLPAAAAEFPFRLGRAAEVVAEIEMTSPGSDWSERGREAAVAAVRLDDKAPFHLVAWAGAVPHSYEVFLGSAEAGDHRLSVARDSRHSAPGSGLEIVSVRFREYRRGDSRYDAIANAPVLFARPDTVGRFTDIPLMVYCEQVEQNGRAFLEYTVIFTNEDGGTSTRALMARWGRTTDIEYILRVPLDHAAPAIYQGKDHKDLPFAGRREGTHYVLAVSTENNMVSDAGASEVRYQLAPAIVDLRDRTRESVMDDHPATWLAMARELRREGKLRPFGVVDGEKAGDPRGYLYLDMKLANRRSAVSTLIRRRGESLWRSSDLGRLDFAISRDGWVRTTVELPPGTAAADIDEIGFQCLTVPDEKGKWPAVSQPCRVEEVRRAFLLDDGYSPGPSLWSSNRPEEIQAGELRVVFSRGSARSTDTSVGTRPR